MDLYKIQSIIESEDNTKITLLLDGSHPVYDGHFPGKPILPGALQIEILKEVFGKVLDKELRLASAKSIKYLGFIDPFEGNKLELELKYKTSEEGWNLRAVLAQSGGEEAKIFMKFSGFFTEV